jgi:cysteine desulfuration protein SufE
MVYQDKMACAMTTNFERKCAEIKKSFEPLSVPERYDALMALGRSLPPYPLHLKTPDRIVAGCQSTLYLHTDVTDGKVFFQAQSDALISAGLAALLITLYSNESPETILTHPPTFLTSLNLSLSLNRSNGLAQIHLRMKQEALKIIVKK